MSNRASVLAGVITWGIAAFALLLAGVADRAGAGPLVASGVAALVLTLSFIMRPAAGLAAFLLVILLAETVTATAGADLRLIDEVSLSCFVLSALWWHRARLRLPTPGMLEIGFAAVLLAGTASSLINAVPPAVWLPALGLFTKGLVFYYLVRTLDLTYVELRPIIGAVFALGLLVVALGWGQIIAPDLVRGLPFLPEVEQRRGSIDVVTSVFPHPALFGWISVLLSLYLAAWFTTARRGWTGFLSAAVAIGGLFSARRTSLVGLGVGLAVGLARHVASGGHALRTIAVMAALVVGLAVVSVPLLGEFYLRTIDEYWEPPELVAEVFADDPNPQVLRALAPRNALYLTSAAIARDHMPLGAGLGRFGSHMSREVYSPVYHAYGIDGVFGLTEANPIAVTDTYWPMVLGETGVIGLVGMGLFVAAMMKALWTAAGRSQGSPHAAFVLGTLMVFGDALVRSLTSAVFAAPPVAYFVLGAAGAALSLSTSEGADPEAQ